MNNTSRFIQASAFVLFATISITSFGMSLEERIKERDELLQQKEALEQKVATRWYKVQKFATRYLVMPLTVAGTAIVAYYLCNKLEDSKTKNTYTSHKGAGVGASGSGLIWGVKQINDSYQAKFEDENKKKCIEEKLVIVEKAIEQLINIKYDKIKASVKTS